MQLTALPAMADNYIWMLHNGSEAVVCDPGEAGPAIDALRRQGLALAAILVTHRHADHIGGVNTLYRQCGNPDTQVYLPAADGLADSTFSAVPARALQRCSHGDALQILGLRVIVLDMPGHTAGHIAYFAERQSGLEQPFVLCGDTLFSAGCGRIFEGTPLQMYASLQKLAALPDETRVCCAHEYTLSNLDFALRIQSAHEATQAHLNQVKYARERGLPSLPSSIGLEKRINPFCRAVSIGLSTEPLDTAWIEGLNHLAQSVQLPAVSLANVDTREPNARKALALALFTLCRELKNRI